MQVSKTDTIQSLKMKLSSKLNNLPISQQQIIFAGITLEDSRTLSDYNISEKTEKVFMIDRKRILNQQNTINSNQETQASTSS